VNANAPPPRNEAHDVLRDLAGELQSGEHMRAAPTRSQQVVESWDEQSWAEFCGTLAQPAFLLAVTGFGEL